MTRFGFVLSTLALGLLTAWAASSVAQERDRPQRGDQRQRFGMQRPGMGGRGDFSFKRAAERFDANDDGEITQEEFTGPKEMFGRMDRNGDGTVTAADFEGIGGGMSGPRFGPDPEAGRPRGGFPGTMGRSSGPSMLFGMMDADSDGSISRDEFSALFKRLDTNEDGQLSREELTQGLSRGRAGGEGSDGSRRTSRFQDFPNAEPAPGQAAPDFELRDIEGNEVSLGELLKSKPVVLEFGSFT